MQALSTPAPESDAELERAALERAIRERAPAEAARFLARVPVAAAAEALVATGPAVAVDVLAALPLPIRRAVLAAAPASERDQWELDLERPSGSVGRLMEEPTAVFAPSRTVAETTEALRSLVERAFVTYAFVVDDERRLLGIVTFRDLLFHSPEATLAEVMLDAPFSLRADTKVPDAMREVVLRHFPVYPVTDEAGRLVGQVRGQVLFQKQAFEISAQAGRMVGVEKEERLSTPLLRSLRFRHPWLQLNLVTAFLAAAVVGAFEGTLDRLVILAAFLPVLAGQSGNTGCQALAVALRGMTLGEMRSGVARRVVTKEALLGLGNGLLVGVTAGLGMLLYARSQDNEAALTLALVVLIAMTAACVVSGLAGVLIPLVLKRLGADPATASSIFLTTATDVVSMGLFLGLATLLVA